ncbi:hypothetical protein EsH8_I_000589 [Colletotrichum jinshuiense]
MDSSPQPTKASKATVASRLGRHLRYLHIGIRDIIHGPKLLPNVLASDVCGFILNLLLATNWGQFWWEHLIHAVPILETVSDNLSGFWNVFWQERWHKEDLLEERAKKWSPHAYHSPPPRLRTYREILNRQQALKNCCGAQLRHLETRDVARNMLLQAALAFCWAWALLKDHVALVRLSAAIETKCRGYKETIEQSVPPVVRKGEGIMPVARSDRSHHCCLGRVQRQIDRGQRLISSFVQLDMCEVGKDSAWDETEWLAEKDGEIPADMPHEDRFLVNRVAFSAGLSWLMVSISCDFATFYFVVLVLRLRSHLARSFPERRLTPAVAAAAIPRKKKMH